VDPTKTVDELLDEILSNFEKEVFSQLVSEPKYFSEELDNFVDWLIDKYEHPKVSEKKGPGEEKGEDEKEKSRPKPKPPKVGTIDAWLGMR